MGGPKYDYHSGRNSLSSVPPRTHAHLFDGKLARGGDGTRGENDARGKWFEGKKVREGKSEREGRTARGEKDRWENVIHLNSNTLTEDK